MCGANEGTIANCYNTAEVGGNVNVGGVCGENYGAITDCYNTGLVDGNVNVGGVCGANEGTTTDCYNTGFVDGNDSVGGVCGVNYATTTDCYNIGAVSGKNLVGGVCGANSGTIAVCCNKGTVMGENRIGGVCGHNFANTTIANCYNAGGVTVTGDSAYAGGLCGFTADQSTVTNSYNAGSITVTGDSAYVGGLCGFTSINSTIKNCYNAGSITVTGDSAHEGGICGYNFVGNIINSYFDSEKYGGNAVAQNEDGTVTNVEGKTTEEFASGEVAYLLHSGHEADENGNTPEVWGQEIGTDTYPVQGGAKVYRVVAYAGCKGNPGNEGIAYSNTDAPVYGDHSFDSNGFGVCGDCLYQPAKWDETNNRYEISNAGQLYWFAQQVNGGTTDINAVLTKDIDLSGTGNWTPIGNAANKYRGTFDGQNHTVKDMSITKQGNNSGLFGYTEGATIKNIIITGDITITAESYTEGYGSIVGRADNNTTVTNCHSSVNITIDSTMESTAGNCIGHIGGIIGKMHYADSPISNCSYSGTIELKDKPINVAAGIVGYAIYSSVPITNCSFTGKINSTNTGATIIGGIFGYTRSSGDVKVTNCLSVGTITKSGDTSVTGILIGQINTGYGNNAVKNNYCISSSLNVIGSTTGASTTAPATLCTETQLTSGEVAYLLQGKQTENVWGQEIGTDTYPVLTSDIAKKVLKVEFDTLGADGEYILYTERYGNYGKVLSDFPEEITNTIWVDGVNPFTASSRVTEDKTVYPVGYSVKYGDDGKVVISAPKMGNYTIIIASYSGKSLLRAKSADIQINNWYESYEITALCGFDTAGADTVKVFFWDTEMRPQCDIAVKTLP